MKLLLSLPLVLFSSPLFTDSLMSFFFSCLSPRMGFLSTCKVGGVDKTASSVNTWTFRTQCEGPWGVEAPLWSQAFPALKREAMTRQLPDLMGTQLSTAVSPVNPLVSAG